MNNCVQIQKLDKDLSITILRDWLKKSRRSLSEKQWELLGNVKFQRPF